VMMMWVNNIYIMCTSEEFFFRILIPAYVATNICHGTTSTE
jgi:hypothetical protein